MVKHVNYKEQGMIGIQENFIESENDILKQSIYIDELIRGNISTQTSSHQLLYVLNNVHARVKQSSETTTRFPSVIKSGSQSMEENYFLALLVTPHSPIKKWYQILCMNLLPRKSVLSLQP